MIPMSFCGTVISRIMTIPAKVFHSTLRTSPTNTYTHTRRPLLRKHCQRSPLRLSSPAAMQTRTSRYRQRRTVRVGERQVMRALSMAGMLGLGVVAAIGVYLACVGATFLAGG